MSADVNSTSTNQLTVPVTGMTCDACEKRVSRALLRLPGVESVRVSSARGTAALVAPVGEALPTRDRIDAALRSAGYEPGAPRWLTRDGSVWTTVFITGAAIAWFAWVVTAFDLTSSLSALADPARGGVLVALALGLTAGVSTCMAMVGGLVLGISASHAAKLAAAGTVVPSLAHRLRPHLAFNLGRILGFGILGALLGLLGLLGSSMSLPTRLTAVLVLGVAVVMSLLGVRLTGMSPRMAAWSPRLPGGLARTLGIDAAAGGSYSDVRAGVVGALTFFLPCGFTQAVQIYAISTASPLTAGLVMATFAVGTTPGLLALATVPEIATGERRTTVLRVVGVVVLAFALLNVSSGLNLLGISRASSASVASAGAAGQQASANVTISNGVQTVAMTQTPRGYEPADTVLYSGLPTTWSITATSPYDCSAFLRVPDLGQQINLTMGVNTVSLPAMEAGVVPFTCVMGMYSGNLIVVDPPATGAATKAGGQL